MTRPLLVALAAGCTAWALLAASPAFAQGAWPSEAPRDTASGPAHTQLPSAPFLPSPLGGRAAEVAALLRDHAELRVLDPGYLLPFAGHRLDLSVQARAFVPADAPWALSVSALGGAGEWGEPFWRFPAQGYAKAQGAEAGVQAVLQAPPEACSKPWRLRVEAPGAPGWTLVLPPPPARLGWAYRAGPLRPQAAKAWGLSGLKAVRLAGDRPLPPPRWPHPTLVVGGDFLYERIEDLVRFLRCQGIEAWGIRPDYGRAGFPPLTQIAQEDAPWLRAWAKAWAGRPLVLEGLCLGGVMARGYEAALRQGGQPVKALATVGAPHLGAPLADWYNDTPWVQGLHRLVQRDPRWAQYHDSEANMRAFQLATPLPPGLRTHFVGLDAWGRKPEAVYVAVDPAIRLNLAWREAKAPWAFRTDGMLPLAHQAPSGQPDEVWPVFHKGMLNLGGSAADFDAYAAHGRLARRLQALASEAP